MNALEKLVEQNRLPILFIGSGLSKRYLYKYPNWDELLEMAFKKYNSDLFQLQKHKDSLSRAGASAFEVNIKLASTIENEFNAAFYDRKIKIGKENDRKRMLGHSFGGDVTNDVYGHRTLEDLRSEIEKIKICY